MTKNSRFAVSFLITGPTTILILKL